MKKSYSIFVIFFQKGIKSGNTFHVLISQEENGGLSYNHANDLFGDSQITNFETSDKKLSFTKRYENRPPIDFHFLKNREFWSGFYKGNDVENGKCNCFVSPIEEYFFLKY